MTANRGSPIRERGRKTFPSVNLHLAANKLACLTLENIHTRVRYLKERGPDQPAPFEL
jgi:hypothetical protein